MHPQSITIKVGDVLSYEINPREAKESISWHFSNPELFECVNYKNSKKVCLRAEKKGTANVYLMTSSGLSSPVIEVKIKKASTNVW